MMTDPKTRLRNGDIFYGQWMITNDPDIARMSAVAGFDYVGLDLQHGRAEVRDIRALSDAIRAGNRDKQVAVVARTSVNDFTEIGRVADAGVDVVIVPLVSTADEARAVVDAARLPSSGGRRSFGPTLAMCSDQHEEQDSLPLVFIMVETVEGLNNVEEICAVEGLDGIYVGPYDLALGLGRPAGVPDAEVDAAIATILAAVTSHGKIAGIHTFAGHKGYQRAQEGFQFVTSSVDNEVALAGFKQNLAIARGEQS